MIHHLYKSVKSVMQGHVSRTSIGVNVYIVSIADLMLTTNVCLCLIWQTHFLVVIYAAHSRNILVKTCKCNCQASPMSLAEVTTVMKQLEGRRCLSSTRALLNHPSRGCYAKSVFVVSVLQMHLLLQLRTHVVSRNSRRLLP